MASFAQNRTTPPIIESPVLGLLRKVHAELLPLREGRLANYIPKLAQVAPDQFGIALATADGHLYEVGDTRSPFTIQSIAKPLVYGLALQDHGRDGVLAHIGVEPSGDPLTRFRLTTGKIVRSTRWSIRAQSRRRPWCAARTPSGGWPAVLLAAVDAGNVVGELALLGSDRPRTANVVAATAVRALALKASELAPLARRNPEILTKLSIAVARALAERLRRANATIRSLTR